MAEEKKEVKEEYDLVQVPSTFELAVKRPDGTLISTELALVEILNKLDKIERAIA